MPRIKFNKGQQRKFLKEVLIKIDCPSLRSLKQRGFDIPYGTLKNYFNENRLLPREFFENLCSISSINKKDLKFEILSNNWGQIVGGKIKRKKVNKKENAKNK